MRLPTLQSLASSPRLHRKARRTAAVVVVACWAASPASASLRYLANAFIELRVAGAYGTEVVFLHDPPVGSHREDSSQVHAGRESLISGVDWDGNALVAQARAVADTSGDWVRASASSNQMRSNVSVFQNSLSRGGSEAAVELFTPITGQPGLSGTVVISGVFWGGVNPPITPQASRLAMSANVSAWTFPVGGSCQQAACGRADHVSVLLQEGATLTGWIDRTWRLELPVVAGHMLGFSAASGVEAGGGYGGYLSIGAAQAPFALAAGPGAGLGADALVAAAAPTAAGGLLRIELSPGLELGDLQGLVRNADGSYGFASPVPEPGTLALWGVAAAFGWAARRRIGRAG